MTIKNIALKFISLLFPKLEANRYQNNSFAQEGEDLIIVELFKQKKNGFFVDVGAHHPFRFSNTNLLKQLGWTGINIEPSPNLHQHFCRYRKDDINLNMGVSSSNEKNLTYYEFDEPALNTFSEEIRDARILQGFKLLNTKKIMVTPLKDIFAQYVHCSIDLLSIDVEGLDFEVLMTNNWELFSPKCILIEDHQFQFGKSSEIEIFLNSKGYYLAARTLRNSIFMLKI